MELIDRNSLLQMISHEADKADRDGRILTVHEVTTMVRTVPAAPTQWISVKERLPKKWVLVLAAYKTHLGKTFVTSATFTGNSDDRGQPEFTSGDDEYLITGIQPIYTHWMPLPEPPK